MLIKETVLLNNDRLSLRSLQVDDITSEYIDGLNNPHINQYLEVRKCVQTRQTVEEFIVNNINDQHSIFLGIFIKQDLAPFIGTIRVSDIDLIKRIASVGICLFSRRAWKKGYALESMLLVKKYLFDEIGIHYIRAGICPANSNSVQLFQRAGFLEYCRLQNHPSYNEVLIYEARNPSL